MKILFQEVPREAIVAQRMEISKSLKSVYVKKPANLKVYVYAYIIRRLNYILPAGECIIHFIVAGSKGFKLHLKSGSEKQILKSGAPYSCSI